MHAPGKHAPAEPAPCDWTLTNIVSGYDGSWPIEKAEQVDVGGIVIWTGALLPILAAVGLLILPGLAISWCLNLRNFSGVALAPVFSTAVVGVSGIVGGWVGIPWSAGLYLAGTTGACVAAVTLSRCLPGRYRNGEGRGISTGTFVSVILAVIAGAVLISWRLMQLFQEPENISQRFDNVFHLNAIRFILDLGNASTLNLGSMTGATGFSALYPAAWHSFVALVSQVSGASIPLAVNSFNIAFSAIAWPLGCIMLVRQVVGPSAVATLAAGVLSAAQLSFPAMLLVWGPLYPNALSLALMPAVIAAVVALTGMGKIDHVPSPVWGAALTLSLPGLATAHTSSLNALLVFTLPLMLLFLLGKAHRYVVLNPSWRRMAAVGALAAVVALAYGVAWIKVRPGFYDFWGPHQTESGAIGEAITNAPMGTSVAWTVSILMFVGFVYSWSRPTWRWVPFSYAITVALYVVDASMPKGPTRAFLTGVWYQDTHRVAAFLPLFATLLAAIGTVALAQKISSLASANFRTPALLRSPWSFQHRTVAALGFILALAAASQYGAIREYVIESKIYYSLDGGSAILNTDEVQLLERIAEEVPADAVIAVNPWNGSSLAYAISGRKVLDYHLFSSPTAEMETINRRLGTDAVDAEVCPAVKANNVQFVLDFGDSYLAPNAASANFPGVTNVKHTSRLNLVDSQGSAKLYRVTGCK